MHSGRGGITGVKNSSGSDPKDCEVFQVPKWRQNEKTAVGQLISYLTRDKCCFALVSATERSVCPRPIWFKCWPHHSASARIYFRQPRPQLLSRFPEKLERLIGAGVRKLLILDGREYLYVCTSK